MEGKRVGQAMLAGQRELVVARKRNEYVITDSMHSQDDVSRPCFDEGAFETGLCALIDGLALQYQRLSTTGG